MTEWKIVLAALLVVVVYLVAMFFHFRALDKAIEKRKHEPR